MKVNSTFKGLARFRNEDGSIELDSLLDKKTMVREVRGNEKRQKEWFDIDDGRAMFKANEEEQIFAHYSELICCELAKQAGLKTAEYDLAMFEKEQGIITKDICDENEELLTINELIGTDPVINPDYPDSVNIIWVFDELEKKLHKDGYTEEDIDECMLGLRKQLLFDIYVMETDRHTENASFIVNKDELSEKQSIRISPMYDTENALVLYDSPDYMKKIYTSILTTSKVINIQEPKMCIIPEEDDVEQEQNSSEFMSLIQKLQSDINDGSFYSSKSEEIWKTTLDFLCEDDRAYDFVEKHLNNMNIKKAIESVESKINAPIQEDVKKMAEACFNERKAAIEFELGLDIKDSQKEKTETIELT